MLLRCESADDFARCEYIGATNGFAHPSGLSDTAEPVHAYVNDGRWLADCPDCRSARMVGVGIGFWCPSCGNQRLHGLSRRLVWPDELDRIERLLLVRPVMNRHWLVGEPVEQLQQENYDRDLPADGYEPPEYDDWPTDDDEDTKR